MATILCVDDDSSVLNALRSLLGQRLRHDQSVELAENGAEALEIIAELAQEGRELSVIIADYIMPGMKGDELLVQVHQQLPKTMKIMLTGQSDLNGVKRTINEANLFRFLEKPWQNEDIVLTVQAAIHAYELDNKLQQKNQELLRINEELENRVNERTQQLQEKNRELEQLAITDRLTGLYNRLFLDQVLEREFTSAGRHSTTFSLILVDIDHFKKVNDSYGHHMGDEVLKSISRILKETIRASDLLGRWGGEEFLILCPKTQLKDAAKVAEKLRLAIEHYDFASIGCRTASFGVACYKNGDTIAMVEARADKALYLAKDQGRNRVVSSG
ncbi:GGDEF domain-containing response regulator [Janthinobacterium sp. B9-8]|uniref:GGDEF domain-containing response regulator n=1 Tax=Janthinobacterium sp. B9-8 TaxID=1236179 RepID=UPI00061D15A3|nr:diguanylate cyclase [Janthinobacterium sp. B9-8]AMC35553.1 diguanylate cyclase response regulator [Janthinobacterium sp. B9-8]